MRNGDMFRQKGFTYLMTLFALAMMGLLLSGAGQVWHTTSTREKEADLLFIGNQFRQMPALHQRLLEIIQLESQHFPLRFCAAQSGPGDERQADGCRLDRSKTPQQHFCKVMQQCGHRNHFGIDRHLLPEDAQRLLAAHERCAAVLAL